MNNDKFKAKFGLPQLGFTEPVNLADVALGFSTYKNRQEPGFRSLYYLYITQEEFTKPDALKAITVHVNYGKTVPNDNGIITVSTQLKPKLNWPIGLTSNADFFYNITSNELYCKGQKIDGIEILKKVDKAHTKPTKLVAGFWLRIKMVFFHIIIASFFKILFDLVAGINYLLSGKKIGIYYSLFESINNIGPNNNNSELKVSSSEPIDLFGYKVRPQVAALYCIFHLGIYTILYRYNYKPKWILDIFENNFLTLMYAIITLGLSNVILPRLFEHIKLFDPAIKNLQNLYFQFLSKKLKL
jgi:hypothetical protein